MTFKQWLRCLVTGHGPSVYATATMLFDDQQVDTKRVWLELGDDHKLHGTVTHYAPWQGVYNGVIVKTSQETSIPSQPLYLGQGDSVRERITLSI